MSLDASGPGHHTRIQRLVKPQRWPNTLRVMQGTQQQKTQCFFTAHIGATREAKTHIHHRRKTGCKRPQELCSCLCAKGMH